MNQDSSDIEEVWEPARATQHDSAIAKDVGTSCHAMQAIGTDNGANSSKIIYSDCGRDPAERDLMVNAAGIWVAAQGLLEDCDYGETQ